MNPPKMLLFAAAAGLVPIALSYGASPHSSIPFLFGFPVDGMNAAHVFRAVMGLYLAQAAFWIAGAFKPSLTTAALWSLVVFMGGLAVGRLLSLVVDGVPGVILVIYLLLEIAFGIAGWILLKRRVPNALEPPTRSD